VFLSQIIHIKDITNTMKSQFIEFALDRMWMLRYYVCHF